MTRQESDVLQTCGGWGTLEFRNIEGRVCHACKTTQHMIFFTSSILTDASTGAFISPEICAECWWKLTPEAVGKVADELRREHKQFRELHLVTVSLESRNPARCSCGETFLVNVTSMDQIKCPKAVQR